MFLLELYRTVRKKLSNRKYCSACNRLSKGNRHCVVPTWTSCRGVELWAHAGSGRLHLYGNSQEAFDDAIARGFKVLEADVARTSDGEFVMSHRFRPNNEIVFDKIPTCAEFLKQKASGKFTPLTLKMFVERYETFDGYISIDPSPDIRSLNCGFALIDYLKKTASARFLNKIIYQINGLKQLESIGQSHPFLALHYCVDPEIGRSSEHWRFRYLIPALSSVGVESVSICDMMVEDEDEVHRILMDLRACGIKSSIVGINSKERFEKWKCLGAFCVNTDYLEPSAVS